MKLLFIFIFFFFIVYFETRFFLVPISFNNGGSFNQTGIEFENAEDCFNTCINPLFTANYAIECREICGICPARYEC